MLLGYETFDSYWSVEVLNFSNETLVFLTLNVFEHNEGAKKKTNGPNSNIQFKTSKWINTERTKKNLAGSKARKNKDIKFDIYTGSCKEKLQYVTENWHLMGSFLWSLLVSYPTCT